MAMEIKALKTIEHKNTTTYGDRNPGSGVFMYSFKTNTAMLYCLRRCVCYYVCIVN